MSGKPINMKRQQSLVPKSGIYWEKVKNVEMKKISEYKSKETNLRMRHYWNDVIREMERLAMQQAEQTKIKINDLSTSLPPKLYKRISKIIPLNPIEDDVFEDEFIDPLKALKQSFYEDAQELEITKNEISAENTTLLPECDVVKILERPVQKKLQKRPKNWQLDYVKEKQKDRIKWNSKLYQLKSDIWEKPLYEQAEDLMDNSVDNFLEWLNNLSTISETSITKDILKELFSLEIKTTTLATQEETAKTIEAQNIDNNSIHLKMKQKLRDAYKNQPKQKKSHAFGRTLPKNMRPWIPPESYSQIKPDIPEDLRQYKIMFEGITHLRATKQFAKYCIDNPHIEKPEYLIKHGCFDEFNEIEKSKIAEPSLCELLELKTEFEI